MERAALLPLPPEPFPSFHEGRRTVHRDGHVEVKRAYYAVPPEYLAREVWVRWDSRLVRIFNERMQPIAVHTRQEPGRFSTPPQYIASEKISGVERGAAWLLGRVATRLGPHSTAWAEAMIQARGVEGRAGASGPLEPCRPPSRLGDRAGLRDRRRLRGLSPPDHSSACQAPGTQARSAPIPERSSRDPSHERVRPIRPRRIPIPEHPSHEPESALSESDRLDLPDPRQQQLSDIDVAAAAEETGGKTGNGAQLRLDKRVPPPTFTIASPGSSEGEAMAKAGGGRKKRVYVIGTRNTATTFSRTRSSIHE